jgi:hypothetical protein
VHVKHEGSKWVTSAGDGIDGPTPTVEAAPIGGEG